MMLRRPCSLAFAAALLTACGDPPMIVARPDAGPECIAGTVVCEGNTVVECDANGQRVEEACVDPLPFCIEGQRCRECMPGAMRCGDGAAPVPQLCSEGGFWTSQPACTGADRCSEGACRDLCAEAAAEGSSTGCDYWPVTLSHAALAPGFSFGVLLANPHPFAVHVRIDGGALSAPIERDLAGGASVAIELPWVTVLARTSLEMPVVERGSTQAVGGAYHVVTDAPIAASQFSPISRVDRAGSAFPRTSGASRLSPALGLRYRALTYADDADLTSSGESTAVLAIVATAGGSTTVEVALRGKILAGEGVDAAEAGTTVTHVLARGDVLQLVGDGPEGELSGSVVTASQPVAVFGGSDCARVGGLSYAACDHLEEQLVPTDRWGTGHVVVPFGDRSASTPTIVRVVADRDDTTVSGAVNAMLDAGEFVDAEVVNDSVVQADGPVSVGLFMVAAPYGEFDADIGGSSLSLAAPIEALAAVAVTATPGVFQRSWLRIVATGAPIVDGVPVQGAGRAIAGSQLSTWTLEIGPGTHRVTGDGPGARFGVQTYGIAAFRSYAYPGALRFAPPE